MYCRRRRRCYFVSNQTTAIVVPYNTRPPPPHTRGLTNDTHAHTHVLLSHSIFSGIGSVQDPAHTTLVLPLVSRLIFY